MKKYGHVIRSIKHAALLCLFASVAPSAYSVGNLQPDKNQLPEIGTIASYVLSIEKEIAMGDIVQRQLRASSPVVEDPILDEYISDLGNRLVAKADNVKYPFTFKLLKANSINAFATFGGLVVIHTKTVTQAETESEFASVVAHEIAHVTQRHLARRAEESQRNAPLTAAALIGSIILAMANPSVGSAALMTTQAGAAQMQLNYTRGNEREADRIGLKTLVAAGFDPQGASDFFGKMAEQTRYSTKLPPMLYSHPLPEQRITDIRSRVDGYPLRNFGASEAFILAKTRILARYTQAPEYHLEQFEQQIKRATGIHNTAARYGKSLALLQLNRAAEAKPIVEQLLKENPNNLHFVDAMTDVLIETKAFNKVDSLLKPYAEVMPNNQVITLNYANALIKGKRYEHAVQMLKDFLLVKRDNHLAWQLLTDAYKGLETKSQYHQARAEVFAQLLAYPKAIDELHTAYTFLDKNNPIEKKRISARIKQFRTKQEELKRL